jgi:hypothetical protein
MLKMAVKPSSNIAHRGGQAVKRPIQLLLPDTVLEKKA